MKTEACERYLADPEANAPHLAECEECGALFDAEMWSAPAVETKFDSSSLPLAPWEGATYRSWPLVIGGALTVLCIAGALFMVAGVGPINGILHAIRSTIPSFLTLQILFRYVGEGLQHAPAPLQIGVAVSFLVVNTILILLLRRSPKGIDV